jgi:hypothetical protein
MGVDRRVVLEDALCTTVTTLCNIAAVARAPVGVFLQKRS